MPLMPLIKMDGAGTVAGEGTGVDDCTGTNVKNTQIINPL
jgi:hypothetical protein